jgi:hypothetical protein
MQPFSGTSFCQQSPVLFDLFFSLPPDRENFGNRSHIIRNDISFAPVVQEVSPKFEMMPDAERT